MKTFSDFETHLLNKFTELLQAKRSTLEDMGITFESPEIETLKSHEKDYESEFRIYLYKNHKFLDIIECHIFRNGKKIAELDEFINWFKGALSDIIRQDKEKP